MEYCCNFCKKTFGNKGALGSHISFCNKNPDRRTKRSPQYYEAQKNKVYKKPVLKKEIKTCPFCKKTWETINFGYTVHTQHCYKNPSPELIEKIKKQIMADPERCFDFMYDEI